MPCSTIIQRLSELFRPEPEISRSNGPLFSIVIPAFRCAEKLERSIASVFAQQRELFELIVIDGNSQDATLEVLRAHEANLRWFSEPDQGVYDAMNKGIARTTGRYLFRDELFHSERPELLKRHLGIQSK